MNSMSSTQLNDVDVRVVVKFQSAPDVHTLLSSLGSKERKALIVESLRMYIQHTQHPAGLKETQVAAAMAWLQTAVAGLGAVKFPPPHSDSSGDRLDRGQSPEVDSSAGTTRSERASEVRSGSEVQQATSLEPSPSHAVGTDLLADGTLQLPAAPVSGSALRWISEADD